MRPDVYLHIREGRHAADLAIGPGKIALLEAIERTGSITAAAKSLGMSYRRAWMLVDETNRCLIAPAVATATGGSRGGGTVLTSVGKDLVSRYRAVERQAANAVARQFKSILRPLSKGAVDASSSRR